MRRWIGFLLAGSALAAAHAQAGPPAAPAVAPGWALAIHGGAGTIPRDAPPESVRARSVGLAAALAEGSDRLARGEASLDVVEAVVRRLEDDPNFNAGKGAVFNAAGGHDLDAAIMDGATRRAGAVAGLTTVRHPVSLARLVFERTPHVFLAGPGAEEFADEMGVERVPNEWFSTPERRKAWEKAEGKFGTVGAVALDRSGRLAAATSSGGMTNKRWGRIGDVPIVGAGTYADDRVAISCTGKGEEFIRHAVASQVALLVRHLDLTLAEAARRVVHEVLAPGDGGLVAAGRDGSLALIFNSTGMYRGAADSAGRFEVAIWE